MDYLDDSSASSPSPNARPVRLNELFVRPVSNVEDGKEDVQDGAPQVFDSAPTFAELNAYNVADIDINGRPLSACEQNYIKNNNCKRVFVAMCFGLAIVNLEESPWSEQLKREVKPKKSDLSQEVERRARIMNLNNLRPTNWTVHALETWLLNNPIASQVDLVFLQNENSRLVGIMEQALVEKETENNLLAAGNWRGNLPYLRMIHCVIEHDEIKSLFLRRGAASSRQELDARNSTKRAPTVYEMIADKWNDPQFNPCTRVSSCHEDFIQPIDCSYVNVAHMTEASASKVEDLFTTMRAHLLRIISSWEQSGQGDGGLDTVVETDVRFGNLADRPRRALDSRHSFLNGKGSHLLYFWEVADEHQLLASALQRISDSASAPDANSVSSVSASSKSTFRAAVEGRKRYLRERDDVDEDAESFRMLAHSISSFSNEARMDRAHSERAHIRQRIEYLQDKQRDYRRLFHENNKEPFYMEEVERLGNEITSLKEELNQEKEV